MLPRRNSNARRYIKIIMNERYKICKICDQFNNTLKTCQICHCFMPIKTKLPQAECPLKKWTAQEQISTEN